MTAERPTGGERHAIHGNGFVPAGYGRFRLGRATLLLHRRSMVVSLALLLATLAITAVTISTGPYGISLGRVARILGGGQEGADAFFVLRQRLPRTVAAGLVGAALGTSGAIFQSVSRNPLGSPDLIGFTTGAATGGLVTLLVAERTSAGAVASGTFVGGVAAAVAVAFLSRRSATVGDRLIVSGIAIAAMLASVNDYLLSRADVEEAATAKAWQHGSLNVIQWPSVWPFAVAVALLAPCAAACSRQLRILELGDDAAAGVGLSLARARGFAMALGVALAAVAVAMAGPIGFVALVAPQLARRLARSAGPTLLASMAMGALLLVASDLLAQRLLSPFQIPVGLVTGALGGLYLTWLLLRAA